MSLGTKNRQRQNAELCRQHLRSHYSAQKTLVEEFIVEIEGPEGSEDFTRWEQFCDEKRSNTEMLQRMEQKFLQWLNGN
jgi:hypothetical protein